MRLRRMSRLGARRRREDDDWWPESTWPNPFRDEWLDEEVKFYALPEPYNKDGVEVKLVEPQGVLDDYFNKNFRLGTIKVPLLKVDDEVWMSITYMEVQSLYVPLALARGRSATAGLGLGYFPLRAAEKPEVESIDVYEREPRVIDFFVKTFSGRPGFEKLNFIAGDVRELLVGKEYDYVFMDPYQTLLPDQVIPDIIHFKTENRIGQYRFWGQEAVILDAIFERGAGFYPELSSLERRFFNVWKSTPVYQDESDEDDMTLEDLYRPLTDEDYRQDVFDALRSS